MSARQINQVQQRVKRYWYEDGIAELAAGGAFLLLGLYFALQGYFGEESPISAFLQASMVLLFILGFYLARRAVNGLKSRIAYPRTGYVEYRSDEGNVKLRRYVAAIGAAALAVAFVVLYRSVAGIDLVVLGTGALGAIIFLLLVARVTAMRRFYGLGAVSLLLGVLLSLISLPQPYSLGFFYGSMGIAMIISGGWTLSRYLRENPIAVEAASGR